MIGFDSGSESVVDSASRFEVLADMLVAIHEAQLEVSTHATPPPEPAH